MKHNVLRFEEAVKLTVDIVPGLKADMERLRLLRQHEAKDMAGIGRIGLNIPDPLMPILKQYKPDLFQDDKELADRAWLRFIQSPDSQPFRINSRQ